MNDILIFLKSNFYLTMREKRRLETEIIDKLKRTGITAEIIFLEAGISLEIMENRI